MRRGVRRAAPGAHERLAAHASRRDECGHDAGRRGADERRHDAKDDDAGVELHVPEARRGGWEQRDEKTHEPCARGDTRDAAGDREHDGLDQQLPHQAPAAAAERRANREFVPARDAPRDEQARDVRAREQHEHRDRAEQRPHRRPERPGPALGDRLDVDAVAAVGFRIRGRQRFRQRLELVAHGHEIAAWTKPADRVDAHMVAAIEEIRVVGFDADGLVHRVVAAVVEGVRQHADDDVRVAVERERLADRGGAAAEVRVPERIAEHDRVHAPGAVVGQTQASPGDGRYAQHVEEVAAHLAAVDLLRVATAAQRVRRSAITGQRADAGERRAPVYEVRPGHRHERAGRRRRRRDDQPSGVAIGQRLEEQAVDDGKDRDGRADRRGEREQHEEGERPRRREGAQRRAKVLRPAAEERRASHTGDRRQPIRGGAQGDAARRTAIPPARAPGGRSTGASVEFLEQITEHRVGAKASPQERGQQRAGQARRRRHELPREDRRRM